MAVPRVDRERIREMLAAATGGEEYSITEMAYDLQHALEVNDRLAAENEALKAEVQRVDSMARERDDFLFEIGKVIRRHEDRLHELTRDEERAG